MREKLLEQRIQVRATENCCRSIGLPSTDPPERLIFTVVRKVLVEVYLVTHMPGRA
jgi:hypothetical protein